MSGQQRAVTGPVVTAPKNHKPPSKASSKVPVTSKLAQPSKARSAFTHFCKATRAAVKSSLPEGDRKDKGMVNSLLLHTFEKLDDAELRKWQEIEKKDEERYNEDVKDWNEKKRALSANSEGESAASTQQQFLPMAMSTAGPLAPLDEATLKKMKVAELKEEARKRSLKVGGKKPDLLARLYEFFNITPTPPTPKRPSSSSLQTPSPNKKPKSPSKSPARPPANVLQISPSLLSSVSPSSPWIDLCIPPSELRCSVTLTTGQSFNWYSIPPPSPPSSPTSAWGNLKGSLFLGVILSHCILISETPTTTLARLLTPPPPNFSLKTFLHNYFQTEVSLSKLYVTWSCSLHFSEGLAKRLKGVRVLRQDPWETLVSFLASSNNAIPRIFKLSETIRREAGELLVELPGGRKIFSYPSLDKLGAVSIERYRELGFGYRDKFYRGTVDILSKEDGLVNNLNAQSYKKVTPRAWSILRKFFPFAVESPTLHPSVVASSESSESTPSTPSAPSAPFTPFTVDEIKAALEILPGVGGKVAECVALFSCDCPDLVPADTHVLKMALRMDPELSQMKPGLKQNKMASDVIRKEFPGGYAGWAHSVLFVAELPSFKTEVEVDVTAALKIEGEEKEVQNKDKSDPTS
ncbi:hypothetical protein TrVE_jg10128 [Triparma verrucosa]|uniref:DNA-(apurinic or apyrimidinic site) lyase n=1 Tax=Triparma verrucosa TaxID=1606542 RepID=A0A9W7C185_9STRA|nr:hypothetical protein TrVE_jg10128 [Triparma verrucosa]